MEMAYGQDMVPEFAVSLPIGAGRLTRDLLRADPPSQNEVKKLRRYVRDQLDEVSNRMRWEGPRTAVATSRTFQQLARLCGAPPMRDGPFAAPCPAASGPQGADRPDRPPARRSPSKAARHLGGTGAPGARRCRRRVRAITRLRNPRGDHLPMGATRRDPSSAPGIRRGMAGPRRTAPRRGAPPGGATGRARRRRRRTTHASPVGSDDQGWIGPLLAPTPASARSVERSVVWNSS